MMTRITSIEEGTHLRLKTERMVVDPGILAWCDGRTDIQSDGHTDGRTYGRTDIRTYGRIDGRTDTASYRDAIDASKN